MREPEAPPFAFRRGTSFYYQIKEDLMRKCSDGTYPVNAQVPSELELARQYGVSRPTIRQAILELVQDGVLSRARGRGTFVQPPVITGDAHAFLSFADEMRRQGMEHAARLLLAREIDATESIAADLHVDPGTGVYEIVRLRIGGGEPLVLVTLQVPAELAPGLLEKQLEAEPVYDILSAEYGIVPTWSTQHFSAVAADETEGKALDVPVGAPLLLWRGVTAAANGRPVAITRALYRGDRFRFALIQGSRPHSADRGDLRIEAIA